MVAFPKISIITPVFNQINFIEKTILSVTDQKYPNLEYIIIDGGSTDGTLDIIKKYDSTITKWISEPDEGMYHALQKGFELSTGEIMGWINSDDLLHFNSLFVIAEVFKVSEDIRWITGMPATIDKYDKVINVLNSRKWSKYNYLQNDYHVIQQESTFWTRSLWNQAGATVNLKYKFAGDLELWSRLFVYESLYSVTTILGYFRSRPNEQLSSLNNHAYYQEVDEILSNMPKTASDVELLRQMLFFRKYKWLLKFGYWRYKYETLYHYPKQVNFSFEEKKFILQ